MAPLALHDASPGYEAMAAREDKHYEKDPVVIFVMIFLGMFFSGFILMGILKGIFWALQPLQSFGRYIKNKLPKCFRRQPPPPAPPVELDGVELQSINNRPKPPSSRTSVPSTVSANAMPAVPPTAHAFYARRRGENPPPYQSLYERIEELQSQAAQGRFTNSRRTSQDEGTRYPRRYV